MENRITSKQAKKEQRKSLKKALNAEKSQGSAIRRLKTLHNQYDFFNLSPFQLAIVSNQNDYFGCIQHVYTKSQQRKIEQLQRIKEGKELLIRESFSVVYTSGEATLKTFGSKKKAQKYADSLKLKSLEIEKKETPISTTFTPNEMLGRLQRLESLFFDTFKEAETVTVAMLKRAIGMEVSDKDKEISKESKQQVKKAS